MEFYIIKTIKNIKKKFDLNENKAKFFNTSNHKKIIYFYFYIK